MLSFILACNLCANYAATRLQDFLIDCANLK